MQFCYFVLSRKDVETEIRKIIYSQIIYISIRLKICLPLHLI